jgi:hypothetical protein
MIRMMVIVENGLIKREGENEEREDNMSAKVCNHP